MKWSLAQLAAMLLVSIVLAFSAGACGQNSQEPKEPEKAQETPAAIVADQKPVDAPAGEVEQVEEAAPSTEPGLAKSPSQAVEDEPQAEEPPAPPEAEEKTTQEAAEPEKPISGEASADPAVSAGVDFPQELKTITIYNASYLEHKKGPVPFSHAIHVSEYSVGCGECHHDENGEPLADLAVDDPVQKCAECHPVPAGPEDKDEYQQAMHKNCRTCHAAHNKETGTKDAPVLCNQCHQEK